ncbi:hypothetical protein PFISCL1PPCAC_16175, partial [Pristionchus fissidentatus]
QIKTSPLENKDIEFDLKHLGAIAKRNTYDFTKKSEFFNVVRSKVPKLHHMFTTRSNYFMKLASTAPEEAKEFAYNINNLMRNAFHEIFNYPEDEHETNGKIVRKMGLKYKQLSREAKKDLDRFFCIKNILVWLMGEMKEERPPGQYFYEVVGLNVDRIMDLTDSKSSPEELKKELKKEAEKYRITTQEYIDTCADIISELSAIGQVEWKEEWNLSKSESLNETEAWRLDIRNEILRKSPSRFYGNFSKQRDIFVSRIAQITEQPREFAQLTDNTWIDYIIDSIIGDKKAAIVNAGRKMSTALKSVSDESKSELERVFCISRTISHFTGRNETVDSYFSQISKEE